MRYKAALYVAVVLTIVEVGLTGCVSKFGDKISLCDSNIVSLGGANYAATGENANGCGETYEARHAAIFCIRMHKDVRITQLSTPIGDIYKSRTPTLFKCVDFEGSPPKE